MLNEGKGKSSTLVKKNMIDPQQLGIAIKPLRVKKNLTQAQLADLVNLRRQNINNIEAGTRIASVEKLNEIYHALGYELKVEITPL